MNSRDHKFWKQLRELFEAASHLPPDQRESLLAQAANESSELKAELVELLHHHDLAHAEEFLERGSAKDSSSHQVMGSVVRSLSEFVAPHIPGYEIEGLLGRGGMGVVWKAHDPVLIRSVAIKQPLVLGTLEPSVKDRFLREARAAARLQHSNICPIYLVSEVDGQPYLVMPFLSGPSLRDWARQKRPSQPQAATVVAELARAVAVAHELGIIHRDIKPSNVIMTDECRAPVLMDFGCAKDLESADGPVSHSGLCVGTPAYMAPEQANSKLGVVDARSDIYSLGIVLYELICGRPAFEGSTAEILNAVCTQDPAPPRSFAPDVHRDLETICLKATAKSPADRYQTAAELADDLERFVAGEYIRARRASVWERGCRHIGHHRAVASLAGVAVAALVLVWALTWRAAVMSLATTLPTQPQVGPDKNSWDASDVRRLGPLSSSDADLDSQIPRSWKPGPVEEQFPGLIRRPTTIPGVKHWQVTTLVPYANVQCLAWHPARDRLAVGMGNGEVRIYDMENDRFELLHLLFGHSGSVMSLDWHIGGTMLATASEDRTIRIWDTETNPAEANRRVACRVLQQHEDVVRSVEWSPDGSTLASGSSDGTVRLWEEGLTKHRLLATHQTHVWKVAWNATGDSLAVGGLDGIVRIIKRDGNEEETPWQSAVPEPHELAFDPLGQHLITCGFEPEVFVRDRIRNQSRTMFTAPTTVTGAAVDRSHRMLAVVGTKLWIWANWRDDPTPREERLINQSPSAVAWSADGSRLAFGGQGAGLWEWNERTRQIKPVFLENGRVIGAAWSSDGTRLATGCGDGRLRVWSRDGRLVTIKTAHTGVVGAVSWSPDGRRVATGGSWPLPGLEPDNSLRLWPIDGSDQPPVRFDSVGAAIYDLSWTSDAQRVVVGTAASKPDDRLVSFNTLTGRRERALLGHADEVMAVACHTDGKLVAAGGNEGKILLSNLSGNEPPVVLAEGLEGPVISLAWDADGKRLAFTCQSTSQSIGLIDLASKRILWRTKTSHRPGTISWSPDGSQLVVGLTGFLSAETGDPINDPSWYEHASVVTWGQKEPHSLIACNDYRLNRLSVFSPSRPDDGWIALLVGDGAASFTTAGELIDATVDAKSQLRYHVETDDGNVSLMSHEEFSSLFRKLGHTSKLGIP